MEGKSRLFEGLQGLDLQIAELRWKGRSDFEIAAHFGYSSAESMRVRLCRHQVPSPYKVIGEVVEKDRGRSTTKELIHYLKWYYGLKCCEHKGRIVHCPRPAGAVQLCLFPAKVIALLTIDVPVMKLVHVKKASLRPEFQLELFTELQLGKVA
jgi:hypothetical protein